MKRHATLRIPQNLYQEIKEEALQFGISISETIIRRLEQYRSLIQKQNGYEKIIEKLESISSLPRENSISTTKKLDPVALEILYLLRELIAERSPQILKRVREKMERLFAKDASLV